MAAKNDRVLQIINTECDLLFHSEETTESDLSEYSAISDLNLQFHHNNI